MIFGFVIPYRDVCQLAKPHNVDWLKRRLAINNIFRFMLAKRHVYLQVCTLITSVKNEKIKLVRALADNQYRKASKKIVCEGLRLVSDALKKGLKPEFILYSEDVFQSTSFQQYFSKQLFSKPIAWKTTQQVISSISDTVTCQGIVAVFEQPSNVIPLRPDWVLICDKIQDPGNLGTLLRSAAAVGVDGVIVSPESTDPYGIKVLRGGMGAQFAIPITVCEDWKLFLQLVRELDVSFFLADSKAEYSHYDLHLVEPLAVIVSSEAHGPSCYVRQLNPVEFKIPMQNSMESLNVAVAGSVFLYEVLRQRRAVIQKN
ncbi:hypothetical protein GpartN1_g878.t1 [Galdieria partita]|uniref:RNA methyltransferase n=1 Tax=Galdieria partita TaxID=83374 RepID=A0A9C7PSY2_9RHOD|nr:hypothetical protein GpartN1_g878.t1 [Galdieria partita]